MSKKKSMVLPPEDEIFESILGDDDFEAEDDDMMNTFGQVAEASVEHMKVACRLTKIIVETRKGTAMSTEDILDIFRQSADAIMDCTPLKALFERS